MQILKSVAARYTFGAIHLIQKVSYRVIVSYIDMKKLHDNQELVIMCLGGPAGGQHAC